MQIEEALAKLAINTGRIATALEAKNSQQGIVAGELTIVTPNENQEELPLAPPTKKKGKKKSKKKNKVKQTVVGKTDDEEVEYDLPGIRSLLHKLQEQENQAAVKSMLKKFGASTLGQVDTKKFAQLAGEIEAQLDD